MVKIEAMVLTCQRPSNGHIWWKSAPVPSGKDPLQEYGDSAFNQKDPVISLNVHAKLS
jgi:hypothetical protein